MIKKLLIYLKIRSILKDALKIKDERGMKAMLAWLKKRWSEPSTKSAVIAAASFLGIKFSGGLWDALWGAIFALILLYEAVREEWWDDEEDE